MMDKIKTKDDKLNYLATTKLANTAQFISFKPAKEITLQHVNIRNYNYEERSTYKKIITDLINHSNSKFVNIRSFSHDSMKGNRLIMNKGIDDLKEIINIVKENAVKDKFTIINENIDISDGGVSGVVLGNIIEFAPEDTPKCVDKEGVCSLPKEIGYNILDKVYGITPKLNFADEYRVEFSIHPERQGVKKEHTIVWEYEKHDSQTHNEKINWPNRFSQFIGDKVFGLLVADSLKLKVPKTTVISRKVAPFTFGKDTGLKEKWIRSCPIFKEPGKYYSGPKWIDPFKLISEEESKGDKNINIASLISQSAIESKYSGASFIREKSEDDIIEGVEGVGDKFMVGEESNSNLPDSIILKVQSLNDEIRKHHKTIGDVSVEWVYDGEDVWIVQLNQLNKMQTSKMTIVAGNPEEFIKFYVEDGLESLRKLIKEIKDKDVGVELIGNVGITSHFGDLLRLDDVASVLVKE